MAFFSSMSNVWNAFANSSKPFKPRYSIRNGYSINPDRPRFTKGNERSIVTSLYNRIALDVSVLNFQHCRMNSDGQYVEQIDDNLNRCLNLAANIDQTGDQFIQDLVTTMFDAGVAAIVPVDLNETPNEFGTYDIQTMRVGRIREWMPRQVQVDVYNDRTGRREQIVVPKTLVAIVENPLYSVMNEPNSTLQRLIRKLNMLDAVDEQSSSGKMDLIIQLPYTIRSEARRQEAEKRRKLIEDQLNGSKYGIAYTDGTERITQLNRSVDNNLLEQIKYLTTMLYGQLGISENIQNGTASEEEMLNYNNRTIIPIANAICNAMNCKFFSQTAITQGHRVKCFRDPFSLAPVSQIADMADKFTRNEIMTSNEFRAVLGMARVDDPNADELRNKNLNATDDQSMQYDEEGNPIDDQSMADGGEVDLSQMDDEQTEQWLNDTLETLTDEQLQAVELLMGDEDDDSEDSEEEDSEEDEEMEEEDQNEQ